MAHHFASIPTRLSMWRRVREYAVPLSMIETATARRAVGDWGGACAAARVDVDLDLRAVRERYGTEFTGLLRADLRRLAPDLLRWHMPRIAPDGRLRPGLTVTLARYPGPPLVHLVVRTPPAWADAGQRMTLALWDGSGSGYGGHHPHPHPDRRFRLDLHRRLWDVRECGTLGRPPGRGGAPPEGLDLPAPWAVGNWAAEAEALLRAEGRARGMFGVRLGARRRVVLELVAPDDRHAPVVRLVREALPSQEVAALPVLPEAGARVLPDVELLRAGLVTLPRLHPLVAAALAEYGAAGASVGAPADPHDPHRVECRGQVHRIALRDGVLTAVDHDPAEVRREELLVALGGPPLPCLRAIDTVHRSPEALPAIQERLRHGDTAGALAVVEGLLGPGALLRDGPLRDELESAASGRIEHGLYRSGLVAVHPAAEAAKEAERRHRHRPDRRTPLVLRRKRDKKNRPRNALSS